MLDFIAAAAMQHARRNCKGAIFAIDSDEGLAGSKAHIIETGIWIEKKDFKPNALEGFTKIFPLLES